MNSKPRFIPTDKVPLPTKNAEVFTTAGQTSTPFAPLNPNVAMVNNSGDHYGNVNPGRQPQVRYTYKFLNRQGALAVALVDPSVNNAPNDVESETTLPRLDIGMAYRAFNWQIFPSLFIAEQSF